MTGLEAAAKPELTCVEWLRAREAAGQLQTRVYGLLPDVSKNYTIVALIEIGCSRISGLL